MHLIQLRFSDNKIQAPQHMSAHQDWIAKGIDDGVFVLVGSIKPALGGAIIAINTTTDKLAARVAADPFVVHGIVTADTMEIEPNLTDPRLTFLGVGAS